MTPMADWDDELRDRVERLLGVRVTARAPVSGGYTPAGRSLVTLQSGETAFVKVGTTPYTAEALRLEWRAYDALRAPFMPRMIAWDDHPEAPVLVLEDLRASEWPPPWSADLVNDVRTALRAVHETRAPFRSYGEVHGNLGDGWEQVRSDPVPFSTLGLASDEWLASALPALVDASARVETEGEELAHFDVRSDNLCRTSRGVVLIDWNFACLGNGDLDTGFWLPSLEAEGGPPPEHTLPRSPEIAAYVSGFFAARAGLPAIPHAPRVRAVQRQQLEPALRWAVRALGLPPLPDGR